MHELDPETLEIGLIAGLGARSRRRYFRRIEARSRAAADSSQAEISAESADPASDQEALGQSGSEPTDGSDRDEARDAAPELSGQNVDEEQYAGSSLPQSHSGQGLQGSSQETARSTQSNSQGAATSLQRGAERDVQKKTGYNPRLHDLPSGGASASQSDDDGGDGIYQNCHPQPVQYAPAEVNGTEQPSDSANRPSHGPDRPGQENTPQTSTAESGASHTDEARRSNSHAHPELSAGHPARSTDAAHRSLSEQPEGCMPSASGPSPSSSSQKGGRNKTLQTSGRALPSRRARWTAANGHAALADMNKLSADSASHMLHGKLVVEAAQESAGLEGLAQLAARFRSAFVEALHPAFLPPNWEVDHSYVTPIPLKSECLCELLNACFYFAGSSFRSCFLAMWTLG